MNELHRDEYYVVSVDGGVLRLARTATAYPTTEAIHTANRALAAAVRGSGVRRILLDLRGGPPGRNDPEFETATSVWRKALAADCDRFAVLVRTVAGKLQSQRLARDEGRTAHVYLDEAEALAYLRG